MMLIRRHAKGALNLPTRKPTITRGTGAHQADRVHIGRPQILLPFREEGTRLREGGFGG